MLNLCEISTLIIIYHSKKEEARQLYPASIYLTVSNSSSHLSFSDCFLSSDFPCENSFFERNGSTEIFKYAKWLYKYHDRPA